MCHEIRRRAAGNHFCELGQERIEAAGGPRVQIAAGAGQLVVIEEQDGDRRSDVRLDREREASNPLSNILSR
jgi:hypothetical protein